MQTRTNTLSDLTSPITTALDRVIEVFDAELRSDLPFVNELVEQVRRYRGKLLRPRLLLLTAGATGEIRREHVVLAAVVEMVHMATLVHDDVLDEAEVRRKGTTVNRLVGNEAAVLLGDYLISHAYHLCSSLASTHASRRIAAVTNTVCKGELMQIAHRGNCELTEAEYLEIIRRKTAVLTGLCCELGAWASGAPTEVVEHAAAYGIDLGMAFQIIDDLLDLTASENELGKTVGRDADLGKWTLPAIHYRDHADANGRARIITALSEPGDKTARLRGILLSEVAACTGDREAPLRSPIDSPASPAIEYATDTARSYVQSALAHLADLPPSDAKDGLTAAAEFIITRRF